MGKFLHDKHATNQLVGVITKTIQRAGKKTSPDLKYSPRGRSESSQLLQATSGTLVGDLGGGS